MVHNEERVRDQGFEEPFDTSPIDTPSNWEYRGIHNTGGHVYCRIWRHTTENKELLYNMLDNRVVIIGAKHSEEDGQYIGDPGNVVAKWESNEDYSDSDLAVIAEEMMENEN